MFIEHSLCAGTDCGRWIVKNSPSVPMLPHLSFVMCPCSSSYPEVESLPVLWTWACLVSHTGQWNLTGKMLCQLGALFSMLALGTLPPPEKQAQVNLPKDKRTCETEFSHRNVRKPSQDEQSFLVDPRLATDTRVRPLESSSGQQNHQAEIIRGYYKPLSFGVGSCAAFLWP